MDQGANSRVRIRSVGANRHSCFCFLRHCTQSNAGYGITECKLLQTTSEVPPINAKVVHSVSE